MKIENKKAYIPCEIVENQINNGLDIRVRIDKTHDLYINRKLLIPDIDQPEPEVTQCVIDWVNNSREWDYDFDEWFDCDNQPMEVYKWLNCNNKRQADLNALALVTLIVNGPDAVTVEKEKLYTVEIPTNSEAKLALVRREDKKIVITIVGGRWRGLDNFQLTEQEIRKDFDWAWQWKKEVAE